MTDEEVLRAHEPILRFTHGELFFPASAEPYIAASDLWMGRSQRESSRVTSLGSLTPETLAKAEAPPGQRLFLRLVQQPLNGVQQARWRARPGRPVFRAAGRLARVGLFARIVDAAFNVSLLLRGTVPGGTASAAWEKYHNSGAADTPPVYYGRVVRQDGWTVLHYIYFYFMNDWRSSFGGANDHESDWEQVFIYVEETPEGTVPVWCAAASHDYSGDDLRRRWDDPNLELDGSHPVLYPGAGSHATYFEQGEYLNTPPLPGMARLQGPLDALRSFWRDTLRQPDPGDLGARVSGWFTIPFVDYGRGDGLIVGPGKKAEWTQEIISDDIGWVGKYRGLFGLDTYDRFAGERAPAGPKFTRDGAVRQSWHDPLSWAGLGKVAPPSREPEAIRGRIGELQAELEALNAKERALAATLPGIGLEADALREGGMPSALYRASRTQVRAGDDELDALRARIVDTQIRMEAIAGGLERIERGERGDPHGHLTHQVRPVPPETVRYGRLLEFWSAIGFALLLLGTIALLQLTDIRPWVAVLIAVTFYLVLESAFRRRLGPLVINVTRLLAVIGALILIWEFMGALLILALVGIAALTIADNVGELRRR